jgi:hypothetical protein
MCRTSTVFQILLKVWYLHRSSGPLPPETHHQRQYFTKLDVKCSQWHPPQSDSCAWRTDIRTLSLIQPKVGFADSKMHPPLSDCPSPPLLFGLPFKLSIMTGRQVGDFLAYSNRSSLALRSCASLAETWDSCHFFPYFAGISFSCPLSEVFE